MQQEVKTTTISKWAKPNPYGVMLKMVVHKWPAGKNKKGKQIYKSQTRHIPV